MLAAYSSLGEISVELGKNVYKRSVGDFLDTIQDLLVALLGNDSLRRISAAARCAEQFLKDVFQIQLSAPSEILGKRDRYAVAVVDLRETFLVRKVPLCSL